MAEMDKKQFMQRFLEEVINRKNLAAVDELVAEDFIEHLPFPRLLRSNPTGTADTAFRNVAQIDIKP
jgi:hypothetical protein